MEIRIWVIIMDLYLDKLPLYLIDFDKGQILDIKAKDIMFDGCIIDNNHFKRRTYKIVTRTSGILNVFEDKELFITEIKAETYMLMKTGKMIASLDDINMVREHSSCSVESVYHDYQQKKCFAKNRDRIYKTMN